MPPFQGDPLEEMRRWVQQYKDDEPPIRLAQAAAIIAMDKFLESWRHGLDGVAIKAALDETQRMLTILNAFQGKLAILDLQVNGVPEDESI